MRTYECPSCGAAVNFASGATVFAVCEHCRTMVVRSDVKLEAIGTMAELPPDLSPLQIGTRGEWEGQSFTLLGRVRIAWEEGSWSEWYSVFNDGRRGWLAESQGFFAVSFLNEAEAAPHRLSALAPGSTVDFAHRRWRVAEGKTVTCIAGEGELPFVAKPGAARYSVDLAGPSGEFGSLEESDGAIAFYEGKYAYFSELKFTHLRAVPGWSDSAPLATNRESRALSCPNCGAPVGLRAPGLSMTVVCGSCQTILDPSKPEVQVLQRAQDKMQELAPVLPLGLRGTFDGQPFEVIGYVVREDPYAAWSEYLLFNPWHGFLWLVTYRGHWSLIQRLLTPPFASTTNSMSFEGQRYLRFADSETKVRGVLGEFYWRVSRGEISKVNDYIAPPKILSRETYPGFNEETWSAGEYQRPEQIARAFNLSERLPAPEGPYLNEPNPYRAAWNRVRSWTVAAVILLCAIEGFFFAAHRPQTVYRGNFVHRPGLPEQPEATTPTFHLTRDSQPVFIEAVAPVENNWVDLDFELVNAATGETRPVDIEVSFYSGRDSDGYWSEGSRDRTADLPSVPQGVYFLRVSSSSDAASNTPLPYSIEVRSGGLFWSNFLLSLGAILIYPAWILWRRVAFERERWSESDFLPLPGPSLGNSDDD